MSEVVKKERQTKGSVYFVHAPQTNRIKIGKSIDPAKRIRALQTSSPEPLNILVVISTDDMNAEERKLHIKFGSDRIHGEWFHASQDILWFISTLERNRGRFGAPVIIEPRIARPRVKPGIRPRVSSFQDIYETWTAVCRHGQNLVMPLNILDVGMRLYPDQVIHDNAVDLWHRSEIPTLSKQLATRGENYFPSSGGKRRIGTGVTARMLYGARDDEGDILAVMLMALFREVTGRSGFMPDTWRGDAYRFLDGCVAFARQRVNDKDWYEEWPCLSTEAFPELDGNLNEQIIPDSLSSLCTLLKAQINGLFSVYQMIRIVPLSEQAA